jgi:transcriptional regulatory protein RtcR
MTRKTVVIGFLGTQLDSGLGAGRWEKWRPTVALMQHEDRIVDRIELLYTRQHEALLQCVQRDIATVSPETEVRPVRLDITDPWDFGEVYGALYDWMRSYHFQLKAEQY